MFLINFLEYAWEFQRGSYQNKKITDDERQNMKCDLIYTEINTVQEICVTYRKEMCVYHNGINAFFHVNNLFTLSITIYYKSIFIMEDCDIFIPIHNSGFVNSDRRDESFKHEISKSSSSRTRKGSNTLKSNAQMNKKQNMFENTIYSPINVLDLLGKI